MDDNCSDDEPTLRERLAATRKSNARAAYSASKASTSWRPRFAPRTAAKRANSDRPREISSRRPVPMGREACLGINEEKKQKGRDPRFEEHTGRVREDFVDEDYAFVDDWRRGEIQKAEKELKKKPRNEELKMKIKDMKFERRKLEEGKRAREIKNAAISEERERVRMGKKAFYPNAKVLKELELKSKYSELKKSGRLQKYIAKRRKKHASKDKKLLPRRRAE
eukprot:Plantae.Rhodophyta-Hildenbrandia_rubra.ctg14036.p1 GENE.Plantae.Rhodophyta-Hildenbrandia_rubra.ctg14036~~Plantae.Rhodophyta-Hildenbrandia_rubra.ctg14036.p1  ORF type:complete len:223 (-),score=55.50 Plantae.Rhodophyta-Hildenbrandia_rubra.ctg14036:1001-1669(-)